MSSASSYRVISEHEQLPDRVAITRMVESLKSLAIEGLRSMFHPDKRLFCFKLKKTEQGMVREGVSHRYTMMTLMGLKRLEETGVSSPIAIAPVLDGLLKDLSWMDNIGDLGVLLWLCAIVCPESIEDVERRADVKTALTRFRQARERRTMELAWFLTGLCHGALVRTAIPAYVKPLATQTYQLLINNQGERGIFGHVGATRSIAGFLRGRVGSFADQVYPIYGISKFSQAFGDKLAVERALDCALTMCEAQGSLGQWWWHYDANNGRVAGRLPVFSVHQHAMGPMALLAVAEATDSDFTPWIYKSLQWIRRNELAFDMEDFSANVVWRSVYHPTARRVLDTATALICQTEDRETRRRLKIMWECRPYELGWFLYAFANWNCR